MNCQDLNSILDQHVREDLSFAQTRDIERHLATCQACRDAWAVYNELVAQAIPETPQDLHRRIATALDGQELEHERRVRRSILVGSALVVGAAVVKTLSLGLEQREGVWTRT
jgi:anti-sigma factor RsiW